MFRSDQVTDTPELRALRDTVDGLAMPDPPPLEAIRAKAHAARRRRVSMRAGLLVTCASAGAALTLAFAGGLGRDRVPGPAPGSALHIIRTPAYTLVSDTSGKVKLTMRPEKLFQPARLQHDLARFGIPARVTSGRFCTSDPAPAGFARAVSVKSGRHPTITIDPSAIRAGTELSFGRFRLGFGQAGFVALIRKQANTCTGTVPSGQETAPWVGYFGLP